MPPRPSYHLSQKLTAIVLTLVALCAAQDVDTTLQYVRNVESRIEVNIDDFDQVAYYHSTTERYHLGRNLRLYPYLAYSVEDSSVSLWCYLHTATSDWLFLQGMLVLVGDKRFTYSPSSDVISRTRRHEVGDFNGEAACVEWLDIRARTRDSTMALFKAIALAPESTKIRIRARGEQDHVDWELTDLERSAWRDVVYYYVHFGMRNRDVAKFIR
jgi:hypothetical protein